MSLAQIKPMQSILKRVHDTACAADERLAPIYEALKATDSIAAHAAADRLLNEVATLLHAIIVDTATVEPK